MIPKEVLNTFIENGLLGVVLLAIFVGLFFFFKKAVSVVERIIENHRHDIEKMRGEHRKEREETNSRWNSAITEITNTMNKNHKESMGTIRDSIHHIKGIYEIREPTLPLK